MLETLAITNKAQILELMERYAEAIRAKDIKSLRSCYAPDSIAFNLMPPLQYRDPEQYFQFWKESLSHFKDRAFLYEVHDLTVYADEHTGFSHGLLKTGPEDNALWMRATFGYYKSEGKWRIIHEHTSVPSDTASGKACLNLEP